MISGKLRHSSLRSYRVPAGSAEIQSSLLFQLAVSLGPRFLVQHMRILSFYSPCLKMWKCFTQRSESQLTYMFIARQKFCKLSQLPDKIKLSAYKQYLIYIVRVKSRGRAKFAIRSVSVTATI